MPVFSDSPSPTSAPPSHDGICVLASGSSGNCSVVRLSLDGTPRFYLIDLGLSPKRTRHELGKLGLTLDQIEAVLLTHLDVDHCNGGWCGIRQQMPASTEVFLARAHVKRSQRMGLRVSRLNPFTGSLATPAGIAVQVVMSAHDDLGAAVFRFDTPSGCLGYATDVGRMTDQLIAHLRGVDVLAIESNYCPQMELSSGRPRVLIQRIMGGRGHLSNHEAIDAIGRIKPRDHVVLLHLSQHCNCPKLVHSLHERLGHRFTIAGLAAPTEWIRLAGPCDVAVRPQVEELMLFN